LERGKQIIKVEVNHQGKLNTNNFDNLKQTYFSQINDEPMWKKIDDNIFHCILLYHAPHHNVEEKWERFDY
jgi:hypothetical protein